ncbi:HEAT repeat protein [Streptomyces sp. TLI_171]|nr:HEAT repeat protein [Streptomyces sp. TLI_171]
MPDSELELGPKRQALYGGLLELKERAEQGRRAQQALCGQLELQKAVRRTGRVGVERFAGKRISSWVPPIGRAGEAQVPQDAEVLLAVVAVWSSWAGLPSLAADGQVEERWLRAERSRWERLLEGARAEREAVRATGAGDAAAQDQMRAAEWAAAVEAYRRRVRELHWRLNLDVLGASGSAGEQPKIEVRQVFMPQLCRPHVAQVPGEVRRLLAAGELADTDLPPGMEAEAARALRKAYHAQPARPVLEVLAGEGGRRLVVLGDPGAGKSTLAKYTALVLAGALEELPAELDGLSGLVPLVVELRQYAEPQWRDRTIEDFLEHVDRQDRMCLTRPVLESLLAQGRTVVFFDGLDEVFDPAVRAQTARRITAFASGHPDVRVVVTSREYGYRAGEFTAAGFAQVMLQDLERGQVKQFIRRWYTAAHPENPSLASQLTQRLLGAVRGVRAVAELAGNPLLLTVLASMGLGKTIPRERREVYAHAVEVLIEQWDKDAKFLTPHSPATGEAAQALEWLNVDRRLKVLQRIARRMQEGAGRTAGTFIHHDELTGIISTYLTEQNISRTAADIAARHVVDRLRTRNFLLAHYGGGIYGFVHRTFLEYLAATELLDRSHEEEWTRDEIVEVLTERAGNPTWHEVLLLMAGNLHQRGVAAFIAHLLLQHRRNESAAGWSVPMLVLAIRVLAEVKEIGASPAASAKDRYLSVAVQSDTVIDALTTALRRSIYLSIEEALPALGTFDRFWSGRERYLRWYYAARSPENRFQGGDVAAALSRDLEETAHQARVPWDPFLRRAALDVLGERWPDDPGTRQAVLAATTDTDSMVRRAALYVLGERWPDDPDTRQAVLAATTDTDSMVRRAALFVLGERWPDDPDTRQAVLAATTDTTDSHARGTALDVLGERWPDDPDTRQAVLAATTDTESIVRGTALRVLGERWPDDPDTRQAVLAATTDTDSYARGTALRVLGDRWPDDPGTRQAVLSTATDTDSYARGTALLVLGERWPDDPDTRQAVLTAATAAETTVRRTAVQVLGERWPDDPDTRQAVLAATTDTTPDVRRAALYLLGDRWPDDPDTRQAVLTAATAAESIVRGTAVQVLGERWPDDPGARQAVLTAATDTTTDPDVRSTALDVLGDRWPDDPDTRQAVLTAATDTTTDPDVRGTALLVLGDRWPDDPDTRQVVLAAATDTTTDPDVRSTALEVLTANYPDVAWSVLREHTKSDRPVGIRVYVIKVLAMLWPNEPDTFALIRTMEQHDDEEVRRTAEEALTLLEQRPQSKQ